MKRRLGQLVHDLAIAINNNIWHHAAAAAAVELECRHVVLELQNVGGKVLQQGLLERVVMDVALGVNPVVGVDDLASHAVRDGEAVLAVSAQAVVVVAHELLFNLGAKHRQAVDFKVDGNLAQRDAQVELVKQDAVNAAHAIEERKGD